MLAMDELATRCQSHLSSFRIKELKDVLSLLGLPKQGKKQILMDKIMGVILPTERETMSHKGSKALNKNVSREDAATVIDDIFRKLRGSGALELGSGGRKSKAAAASSSLGRSDDQDEVVGWDEAKTRCPCGNSVDMGTMIQCDDSKCGVWQHMNCVVIPDQPSESVEPDVPLQFYCELCRISRCDPFCVAVSHPLLPIKLTMSLSKAEGANPLQSVEKTFSLTRSERDLLHKENHDLQVWCVLLNDKVPFRLHWAAYADLRVNGVSVRVTNRPGQQLLGANGRDEGPGITACTREGINRLSLTAYDARPFCVGVRIIRRCSLQQVMAMIPAVTEGEALEDAMARLSRCINGGGGQGTGVDDDDDSDVEVVAESISVNLRCPMSGSRIRVAGRFKPCLHMGCFDLNTFVELNQRARKWQCPICLKNYSIETLIVDPLFNLITTAMKDMGEDVTEVEMKADGLWRPKLEGDAKFRERWRTPSGTPVTSVTAVNGGSYHGTMLPKLPIRPVKAEEVLSSQEQGSLRLGIKRASDGLWTANGSKRSKGWADAGPSRRQKANATLSQSSSATDSNEEEENVEDGERSVNQEPSDKDTGYSEDNEEVGFPVKSVDGAGGAWKNSDADPLTGGNVIVLSDTDEEDAAEPILHSAGASVYGEIDILGHSRVRSPDAMLPSDLHCDSPGLMLPTDIDEGELGVRSGSLGLNAPSSTRIGTSMAEKRSSGIGLCLQMENRNFWSPQLPSVQNVPYGYFNTLDPNTSHHPPPVRPTPVQAVVGSAYGLPSPPSMEDSIRGSGWTRYSRPSPKPPFPTAEGSGGSNDGGRGASPSDSALRLFLPPQPARLQVQSNLREPLISQGEQIDNTWFSLSLGGGDSVMDSAAPPCIPSSSSQEPHRPTPKARGGLDSVASTASVLLGMSSNGTQSCWVEPQGPGHNRSAIGRHQFPARHRSSPSHGRRHHRHFRVNDSESD